MELPAQARVGGLLVGQGDTVQQAGDAVPGLQGSDEPDGEVVRIPAAGAAGRDPFDVHSVRRQHGPGGRHPRPHPADHGIRDAGHDVGRRGVAAEHRLSLLHVEQLAVPLLLLDQRRIDLQHGRHVQDAGHHGQRRAEQRIALVEQPAAVAQDLVRQAQRGVLDRPFPRGGGDRFRFDFDDVEIGKIAGPLGAEQGAVDGDGGAGAAPRPDDFLDMDGGALGAEDRNAGVGAEIGHAGHATLLSERERDLRSSAWRWTS
ncbi:hypothetical protein SRABI128_04472 [Microbacterium sp. Bi128]|nr:hypothetical protein SRABI128_04472 [Microbacterium sp. Bi128]